MKIRESYALIHKSFAFIRDDFALIREKYRCREFQRCGPHFRSSKAVSNSWYKFNIYCISLSLSLSLSLQQVSDGGVVHISSLLI